MTDHRLLADVVDLEGDDVVNAAGLDVDSAAAAVDHERHGDNGLESVALRAASGTHIRLAAADPDREVEHPLHRLYWDARAVVRHRDAGLVNGDGDLRRD